MAGGLSVRVVSPEADGLRGGRGRRGRASLGRPGRHPARVTPPCWRSSERRRSQHRPAPVGAATRSTWLGGVLKVESDQVTVLTEYAGDEPPAEVPADAVVHVEDAEG